MLFDRELAWGIFICLSAVVYMLMALAYFALLTLPYPWIVGGRSVPIYGCLTSP